MSAVDSPPAEGPAAIAGASGRPVLHRIARLLSPYKGWLLLVALAVLISAALSAVAPFVTRAVFDEALFPVRPDGTIGRPDLALLYWLIAALIAIPLVSALIGVGQAYLTNRVGNSAMADLRVALFEHLEKMELAFFTSTKTGEIQSRLANDVSGVRNVLTSTATTIVQNVVTVAAAFVSMILLSWQLTIISLVLMPVFMVIQLKVGRRRKRLQKRTQENLSEMTAMTEESLGVSGVLLAKVFNRADTEVERYRRANRRQTRLQLKQAMTGQTFFSIVSTFFGLTPAIVYLVAGLLINGGTLIGGQVLTAGTIIAYTTLQARLQQPLVGLMRVTMDVQTSFALFTRLFEYLDMVPAIRDRAGAGPLAKAEVRGLVELRDVWFRYPAPREVGAGVADPRNAQDAARKQRRSSRYGRHYRALEVPAVAVLPDGAGAMVTRAAAVPGMAAAVAVSSPGSPASPPDDGQQDDGAKSDGPIGGAERWTIAGVSLTVRPGQLAAIVGPSGSGKTTLTYLIPRLHEVTQGAVLIDGQDVRDITLGSLADVVGMVTQEPYLFHGTITENLRYARADASDAEIVEACRSANIHDRIMSFADGYETITGERGFRLSGGEKQRLAIARVLIKDPRILILDEATSALDTATERLVQEALECVMADRTTFAIAHRLSTIMSADVIFGIADGRLVEQGTHAELLAAGGLYAKLYEEQFGGGTVEARFDDAVVFTDGTTLVHRPGPPKADMPV
ncbi:ABC transporter transmembrane domain-containing protein [Propionicicella superfundia]|uniref:ABC transporter transmembrane domain-containing protein n=1 Tax=Propionicicella superfundia TaxID=348582 RepID=UPI0005663F80